MLVIGSILAIILTGAYIFLGMKIAESIVQPDVKIFFWGLYCVTLLTLVNVSLSVFFYSKIAQKQGPLGPRGVKGSLGEKGNNGICTDNNNNNTCKVKTVQVLLEEVIQDYKNESDITPLERKKICNIVNHPDNVTKIKTWGLGNLKTYRNNIKTSEHLAVINDFSLEERISRQNDGSDNLVWLTNLIITGCGETEKVIANQESTTECV